MNNIQDILTFAYKGCEYFQQGDTYDGLDWRDTNTPKPTLEELQAASDQLDTYRTLHMYQGQRVSAYPSIPDQLDYMFHNGFDAWKAMIQAIKDEFPKPGNL